jgi:hypothetical protein
LEKAFAPGAVAAHVAREANIGTGQLYTWRKRLMKKKLGGGNGFVRVVAVSDESRSASATKRSGAGTGDGGSDSAGFISGTCDTDSQPRVAARGGPACD